METEVLKDVKNFAEEMERYMIDNYEDKGDSYNDVPVVDLWDKFIEKFEQINKSPFDAEEYVHLANYCMMLYKRLS